MTDWEDRIEKVSNWLPNLDDEEMAKTISILLLDLENTLNKPDVSENTQNMIWSSIRAIASKSPIWPRRRMS